jgi:hypothetical protein
MALRSYCVAIGFRSGEQFRRDTLKKTILIAAALLAGCSATKVVQKSDDGTFFRLESRVTESKSNCQVLVDGKGQPYAIKGAYYAKRAPGCQWGQKLNGRELKVANDLNVSRDTAQVVWDTGVSVYRINEYDQVRSKWVAKK